jgi:hypothetical protein
MSDASVSQILPAAVKADHRAVRDTLFSPLVRSMTAPQGVQGQYVPLSERSCDQLLAKAEELRHMAETATTAEVARALVTLADRYAALAAKRRAEERLDRRS